MNIWNIEAWQRQKYLTSAVSFHFMSLSDVVTYLLDSIMLLSQIIATIISIVKFERHNLPYTIEDILKGEFNWNIYEITPPCYVIIKCKLYRLYFKQHGFLKKEVFGYTRANFHYIYIMLRHLVAEISRFKFDDYRVIRTGASDIKLFWAVYITTALLPHNANNSNHIDP